MIYDKPEQSARSKLSHPNRSVDERVSDSSSKKPSEQAKSPLVLSDYVDKSTRNIAEVDVFARLVVNNPQQLKTFPATVAKPTPKELSSNKKSKASDNPESLRDVNNNEDLEMPITPEQRTTHRSLDIDGAIDPELEEKFNQHINTQLLGKLVEEQESNNQSSAKPSKKSSEIAPAGPFRQRR